MGARVDLVLVDARGAAVLDENLAVDDHRVDIRRIGEMREPGDGHNRRV